MEDLVSTMLPALTAHVEGMANALTMRLLDMDVHRRKWTLNIQGIKGQAGEEEDITQQSCVKLARDQLGVNDALPMDFAACHRLRQQDDASILIRFVDLNKWNQWLSSAKNLKGKDTHISISPDLPPVLYPFKCELLNKWKTFPPQQKSKAHLRYLCEWPYIELSMGKNVTLIRPKTSKRSVVQDTIGFSPLISHWTIWTIIIYNHITEFALSVS